MHKIQVTVPVLIGGKPFAEGDVVEVDDYEARLLVGVGRAVLQDDPADVITDDPAVGDAGEDDAKKGKRK